VIRSRLLHDFHLCHPTLVKHLSTTSLCTLLFHDNSLAKAIRLTPKVGLETWSRRDTRVRAVLNFLPLLNGYSRPETACNTTVIPLRQSTRHTNRRRPANTLRVLIREYYNVKVEDSSHATNCVNTMAISCAGDNAYQTGKSHVHDKPWAIAEGTWAVVYLGWVCLGGFYRETNASGNSLYS
jgi:hypothetical protein